jgi:hypothetical protein
MADADQHRRDHARGRQSRLRLLRELPTGQLREEECDHMLIRSRMGVSVDGFVATPEGVPTLAVMPDFGSGVSYGFREFIEGLTTAGRRVSRPQE